MLAGWFGRGLGVLLGVTVAVAVGTTSNSADAARARAHQSAGRAVYAIHAGMARAHSYYAQRGRSFGRRWGSVLQCVPFARENSGIELSGNAGTWWSNAEGLYERGARPEVGSVLNFRATGHMRMGHVAVVTNVVNGRHIEIDHANWGGPGQVSRDIDVVDVSPSNDWTAVRVALGHSEDYGSVYPTYGFIYDRPDRGVMVANSGVTAAPVLNPAPADLRPASERIDAPTAATAPEEVAEAADDVAPRATRHRGWRSGRGAWTQARGHFAPHAAVYRVSSRSAGAVKSHHRRRRS